MSDAYVTIEGVTYRRPLPSGKSFEVEFEGHSCVIPAFAVGTDSEIWVGSVNETTGRLVLFERIAEEKGLLGGPTEGTKIGIPLKRHRLPSAPDLLPAERIDEIRGDLQKLTDAGGWWLSGGTDSLMRPGGDGAVLVAYFQSAPDADFCAKAPGAIMDLLEENSRLRNWVEEALKTKHR